MSPSVLAENIEQAARRMLVDCLLEQTAAYWQHRADDFRAVGNAQCDAIAEACENRARVSLLGGDVEEFYELLDDVLAEEAS